jgi:hypothetical protein
VKEGISQSPKTPFENPTMRREDAAWKVDETTLVPGWRK